MKVLPVRTIMNGLCYKLEFSKPLPHGNLQYLILQMSSFDQLQDMDEIKKINLWIAANNTWQGIMNNEWPYSQIPPVISGDYSLDTSKFIHINLEEHIWKYRTGQSLPIIESFSLQEL